MKLSIYSLRNILYQNSAVSFNCKTEMGEITVLDNHQPLIAVLQKGDIKVLNEEQNEVLFNAKSGFLEIKPTNEVRILIEE